LFVVTIDTEEEGLWSGSFRERGNSCENIKELPHVQAIFEKHGVVATYLVDYPVVTDPAAIAVLESFRGGAGIEIGAHLHPWCNPPFSALPEELAASEARTFAHRLPVEIQRDKLRALRDRIAEVFQRPPTSYRAGRWGFDATTIPLLEELGFTVDSSVFPLSWERVEGGPDFSGARLEPYRLSRNDACRAGDSAVIEVPATGIVTGAFGALVERLVRPLGPRPGMRRVLEALGYRSLRPELWGSEDLRRVADAVHRRGAPVFNLMFHSSACQPGATPYVRTHEDRERFCARIDDIVGYVMARYGARPVGLSSVPSHLGLER
jgi:peptidoglycan/xylan/chitin deacetylase (PgdA/CDA1 family)